MDNPSVWFQTTFAPNVTHRFRSAGFSLKGCVTPGEQIGSDTYRFYLMARGKATERSGGKYNFVNNGLSSVDIKAKTYDYAVKVRDDDIRRMSVEAVDAQAKAAAEGCGHTCNDIIIGAMAGMAEGSGLTDIPASSVVGADGSDFKITHLIGADERLAALGVPNDGDIWGILPARWWSIASMSELFSSSLYTGAADNPLVGRVQMKTFSGVHWIRFPDELVSKNAGDTAFISHVWHRSAIGAATIDNGELRTKMKEISDEPATALITDFDLAASPLQGNGVVRIRGLKASAYPTATTAL